MSHDTAFLGANTILGQYWTKRRHFDYLIDKENFSQTFGHSFRKIVFLDSVVANGPRSARADIEADTRATNYLISRLSDIRPELTVFVTTCDMLQPDADEKSPIIEQSDDPFVMNRIRLYRAINHQYGRVLNVHLPEIASLTDRGFSRVIDLALDPPKGRGKLPLFPEEKHQLYFNQRILLDVEMCIPLGIPSIIPATPPLTTREILEVLNPDLLKRLPEPKATDPVGSDRKSIHSFQWHDPKTGYVVSKDDQIEMLKFFFAR